MPAPAAGDLIYPGYKYKTTVYFSSSGTFTKSSYVGIAAVRVRMVGGGGGSGAAQATTASQVAASGAGGGGEYAEGFLDAATLSASTTVTRGAGGAAGTTGGGGTAGSAGGTSSFGAHITALGGGGGAVGVATSGGPAVSIGGAGGTGGSGGDLRMPGGPGVHGNVTNDSGTMQMIRTNFGGPSQLGPGGQTPASSTSGAAGGNYGGGASGAVNLGSQSARNGSAGGPGIVVVDVFV